MWLKIVAGLAAALAVVTVGVFAAMPSTESGCGSKCLTPTLQGKCCPSPDVGPAEAVGNAATPSCCSAAGAKTVDAEAIAACGGGLTAVPATKAKAKFACCSE